MKTRRVRAGSLNDGTKYRKVRFTDGHNATSGLVFVFHKDAALSLEEISRYFPWSESMKMRTMQVSPAYNDLEEAFNHDFDREKTK